MQKLTFSFYHRDHKSQH